MRLLAFVALLGVAAPAAAAVPQRRVAVVVGNNRGAPSQGVLRYAEEDARAMQDVLEELGGIDRTHLLLGADAEALGRKLDEIHAGIEASDVSTTVFFFYSGHADERSLLMGGSRFELADLRRRLEALPAQLFVAVLDACQAGTVARTKGGTAVQVVDVDVFDRDERQFGGIYITSSAPGENSLESDELGASFFTHYLVSGLRGAADESGDDQVSLEEAYRFAYRQTVVKTAGTLHGPQHPTFALDVEGRGDIVLTWLEKDASYLVLPETASGSYVLKGGEGQRVVAELSKVRNQRVRIALPPGSYEVAKADRGRFWHQMVEIAPKSETTLDERRMKSAPLSVMTAKSSATVSRHHVAASYRAASGFLAGAGITHGGRLAYGYGFGALELGAVATLGQASYRRDDGRDVTYRQLGGGVSAAYRVAQLGSVGVSAGGELGLAWGHQLATTPDASFETRDAPVAPLLLRLGLDYDIADSMAVLVDGNAGVVLHDSTTGLRAPFSVGVDVGVRFGL